MKACLETTSMFCSREKLIGLKGIQQNEKSTQIYLTVSQAESWTLKLILTQITGIITNMTLLHKIWIIDISQN